VSETNPPNKVGIAEGAEMLGVTTKTIRRYIASGALPAYRVGPRLIRIDVADIQALMRPVGGGAK
jgi:excisionase family DNA binding protein